MTARLHTLAYNLGKLPAHAGDARADQRLVADQPEGEADQDRREGRHMWTALHGKHFFGASKLRSFVRPLSVRSICARALMKSDDRDPYQPRELFADEPVLQACKKCRNS